MPNILDLPPEIHIEILYRMALESFNEVLEAGEVVTEDRIERFDRFEEKKVDEPLNPDEIEGITADFIWEAEQDIACYLVACDTARRVWEANRWGILKRAATTLLEWSGPFLEKIRPKVVRARFRMLVWEASKAKSGSHLDAWIVYQHHQMGFWAVKDKEEALKRI
jgi:hypothetical protein